MTRLDRIRGYEARFWSNVEISDGCWRWKRSAMPNGYGQMFTGDRTRTGGTRMTLCHRMSWALVYGEIPAGTEVMHLCDNPICVRPSHLRLGSHADNMADAGNKGIMPWGHRHHWRKISVAKAREVKSAIAKGGPVAEIARACGVNYQCVYDIQRGRSWRHL